MTRTSRVRGLSLVEAIIAIYLLLCAFMVVINLFHTAMRYGAGIDRPIYATVIAGRKLEEIRRWAWTPAAKGYNFHGDWSAVTVSSRPDDENPEYYVTVRTAASGLLSPCSSFESAYPEAERKSMDASAKKVKVTVSWSPGDASKAVSLVSVIREPSREFRSTSPIVVTPVGTVPSSVSQDGTVSFTVKAYDSQDVALEDLVFRWYVEPMTGNGTLVAQAHNGTTATFAHKVLMPNNVWGHAPGQCKMKVRAVYRGVEQWGETPVMELAP